MLCQDSILYHFSKKSIKTLLPLAAYAFGPSGRPGDPSTAMYSIPDVCQRLESGAAGEKRVFRGPSSAPGTVVVI